MHEPDAPPRLLRRVLVWGVAAVILTPVLYVAASGPIWWWVHHHDRDPQWYPAYERSLAPLYHLPGVDFTMYTYRTWCEGVPAPRFLRRAEIVDEIEVLKKQIENASMAEQRWREQTARVESAMKRLRVLLNQPETQPGRDEEIARLKAELDEEIQLAAACQPVSAGQTRSALQLQLDAAEQQLRQFDAR